MYNFWSKPAHYLTFRQLGLLGSLLCTSICFAQAMPRRAPANYIPDDDVIIRPESNEISFYQQYVKQDESQDVVRLRNQLKVWNDNQVFANQYGMSTTLAGSPYFVPNEDEKWEYFKDKYLRYLRRRGEQPFKDMPKNWYQEYRASNEVDTIDEMEARFQKTNKTTSRGSALPSSLQEKEVSLWKKTKFTFQPRVDQGLAIVGFTAPYVRARAWVGINGQTEINIQHSIDSAGFRVMYNHFTDTGKYFTSVDKRIVENVYARYTASKDPLTEVKDDTLMLLYAKQF